MILAIDIGNTTVTLGGVQTAAQMYSLEFTARIDINYCLFYKSVFPLR